MNKDSAAWLALRIIGVLVLGRTFLSMLSLAVDIVNLWGLRRATFAAFAPQTAHLFLLPAAALALVETIFFAAVAYYFLRKGRAVHKLLMHESIQ
jgi:hypothetical protein